jgi:hypothetical protein
MCENKAVNEATTDEAEIRGGDRPTDYIKPIPSARPLRADAHEAEEDLDDDES